MPVVCMEIPFAGAGPPGRSVQLGPVLIGCDNEAEDYAERAAHYFDNEDQQFAAGQLDTVDLDGKSRVIEVCGLPGGPERFRVTCKVTRSYEATRLES